jgi:hypothetical protein
MVGNLFCEVFRDQSSCWKVFHSEEDRVLKQSDFLLEAVSPGQRSGRCQQPELSK